jgi:hypothetical protein
MKRFLIFLAVFPPLALAIFLVPEARASGMPEIGFVFMTLAYVYPIGMIPASVTAAVDWSLSERPVYLRIAVTVIFAAILAGVMTHQLLGVPGSVNVWLTGAIPAAVCSWLAAIEQA